MTYFPNETYIPNHDRSKIEARVIERFNSYISGLNDSELSILDKSEKDFKAFIADIFLSVAELFGYILGGIIGTVEELVGATKAGWNKGFNYGRSKNRRFS